MGIVMHVHGPLNNPDLPPQSIHRAGRTGSSPLRRVDGGEQEQASLRTELVATESAQLVDKLRGFPEVREDKLDQIRERMANGEYLTHDAAQQTAKAIADSPQFFEY